MVYTNAPGQKNALPAQAPGDRVEIVDLDDRPFLIMPTAEAQRQQLRYRRVSVLFFDNKERLLLTRMPTGNTARWDLPAQGPVFVGEARHDAALRLLRERVHLMRPHVIACPPPAAQPFSRLISVFRADAAHERPKVASGVECLFADVDELAALAADFSEMLAPSLLCALEGYLLPSKPQATQENNSFGKR